MMIKKISLLLMACCVSLFAQTAIAATPTENTPNTRDGETTLPAPILNEAENVQAESFTATWTYPGTEDVTFYLEVMNSYGDIVFESPASEHSCDVTWLLMGHTYTFHVKAILANDSTIESDWSETKTVTTLAIPTITVSPTVIDMTAIEGDEAYATFLIQGQFLTDDVHITLNDPSGLFRISRTMFSAFSVEAGAVVTCYFNPVVAGNYTATCTITSPETSSYTVTLNGTATMRKETPVMNEAQNVAPTSFKASWTSVPNAESYNLYVDMESSSNELLIEQNFINFVQNYYTSNTLSQFDVEGWTGKYVYAENGALRINDRTYYPGYLITPALDLRQSGGYVTVTINAKSYSTSDRNVYLTVKSSSDSKQINLTDDATDYTVLLGCQAEEGQTITIEGRNTNQKRALVYNLAIYNGDATGGQKAAVEQGDSTQRIITGITDTFYTVNNLKSYGTFNFKVQPVYTDGTLGNFSNIEQVTLADQAGFLRGDVNADGEVDVRDITALIDVIMNSITDNPRADVSEDGEIDVRDITALIDIIMNS